MRIFLIILSVVSISAPVVAGYVSADSGNKSDFMTYCTDTQRYKQSKEYCQCASDTGFDKEQENVLGQEGRALQSRKHVVVKALEYSKGLDPAMTVERLDALCDISDAFYRAKEDYYFKVTGRKIPGRMDHEQKEQIKAIQQEYDAKVKNLHDLYGSKDITIIHYRAWGGGYCVPRRELVKGELAFKEYLEKDKAGDVIVSYGAVLRGAVAGQCKTLFKAPNK